MRKWYAKVWMRPTGDVYIEKSSRWEKITYKGVYSRDDIAESISKLQDLNEWETNFINSIKNSKYLTDKQREVVYRILTEKGALSFKVLDVEKFENC